MGEIPTPVDPLERVNFSHWMTLVTITIDMHGITSGMSSQV
jgi:hypothetical protein